MTSLNRREFFEHSKAADLSLAAGGMVLANSDPVRAEPVGGALSAKARLRDVGYVWEGQPAYRDFPPSMYGLGEGCAYFGLPKDYYLYHGNNAAAQTKLAHLDEVLCDISIRRYRKVEDAQGTIGWGFSVPRTEGGAVQLVNRRVASGAASDQNADPFLPLPPAETRSTSDAICHFPAVAICVRLLLRPARMAGLQRSCRSGRRHLLRLT